MIIFVFVTLLIWVNEQFLQGNVPSWHMLNAEPLFMYWQRSVFREVNDWALNPRHKCKIIMTSAL